MSFWTGKSDIKHTATSTLACELSAPDLAKLAKEPLYSSSSFWLHIKMVNAEGAGTIRAFPQVFCRYSRSSTVCLWEWWSKLNSQSHMWSEQPRLFINLSIRFSLEPTDSFNSQKMQLINFLSKSINSNFCVCIPVATSWPLYCCMLG